MELEKFLVKEDSKKKLEELPAGKIVSQKEIGVPFNARMHAPNVFEHQYAEYISGLKPPYTTIGFPSRKFEGS